MVPEGQNFIMRNILLLIVLLVAPIIMSAQKDVTTFLGIPVDGLKSDMINALKAKGFVPSELGEDNLEGEFNGQDVILSVVTNNNKVYRIGVFDKNEVDETAIKIRFNGLCQQFELNDRYISMGNYIIPNYEDISDGLTYNNKRYEAVFYQKPETLNSSAMQIMQKDMEQRLLIKYSEEQLAKPSKKIKKEIAKMNKDFAIAIISMKSVWFMIDESFGKYRILMYYDNGYNQANGEDL